MYMLLLIVVFHWRCVRSGYNILPSTPVDVFSMIRVTDRATSACSLVTVMWSEIAVRYFEAPLTLTINLT